MTVLPLPLPPARVAPMMARNPARSQYCTPARLKWISPSPPAISSIQDQPQSRRALGQIADDGGEFRRRPPVEITG
jgi:hypothetical protein